EKAPGQRTIGARAAGRVSRGLFPGPGDETEPAGRSGATGWPARRGSLRSAGRGNAADRTALNIWAGRVIFHDRGRLGFRGPAGTRPPPRREAWAAGGGPGFLPAGSGAPCRAPGPALPFLFPRGGGARLQKKHTLPRLPPPRLRLPIPMTWVPGPAHRGPGPS